MATNIRTVAKQAGVSAATVSRVLNAPDRVSPDARARVMAAMEALQYQPSEIARTLSSHRSRTIGVIVPGISNHFFIGLHKGIHAAAYDLGLDVMLYDSRRTTGEVMDGFYTMKQRHIDGIVFSSAYITPEYERVISRLNIPVVLALTESAHGGLLAFKVDDIHAAFDAVSFLIARGHRRVAMVRGPVGDRIAGLYRYEGYCQALKHHGIPVDDSLVIQANYFQFPDGYEAMSQYLTAHPDPEFTAVFCASDEIALGCMRALHEVGIVVPDRVSVMGFDDLDLASMVTPKLSTVAQPFFEIGASAVRALKELLDHSDEPPPSGIRYARHHVIGRESVTSVPPC